MVIGRAVRHSHTEEELLSLMWDARLFDYYLIRRRSHMSNWRIRFGLDELYKYYITFNDGGGINIERTFRKLSHKGHIRCLFCGSCTTKAKYYTDILAAGHKFVFADIADKYEIPTEWIPNYICPYCRDSLSQFLSHSHKIRFYSNDYKSIAGEILYAWVSDNVASESRVQKHA